MATSSQSGVYTNTTYVDDIKSEIIASGGTIIHVRNNIIIASEISESEYRELLKNPYIDKLDVIPFKRYANEGVTYQQYDYISEVQSNTIVQNFQNII